MVQKHLLCRVAGKLNSLTLVTPASDFMVAGHYVFMALFPRNLSPYTDMRKAADETPSTPHEKTPHAEHP